MAIVYLGIGSNLQNRELNIRKAISLLEENGIKVIKSSDIIETTPADGPPQNNFLNLVIKVKTSLNPHELLKMLKYIEQELGRIKTVINGPRTIDLDILLYDNIKLDTDGLKIPHPRMLKRDFVMRPLSEIEPKLFKELINANN